MQNQHKASKVGIEGESGTGKTTYAMRYFVNSPYALKFAFDFESEITERLSGYGVAHSICHTEQDLTNAIEKFPQHPIVFDSETMFGSDIIGAFDYFTTAIFDVSSILPLNKLWYCDELQTFVDNKSISPGLLSCLTRCRKRALDTVFTQSSFNMVHNVVRGSLTEMVAFRTLETRALQPLSEFGFSDESIARIQQLQDGEYMLRNKKNGAEIFGRINLDGQQ